MRIGFIAFPYDQGKSGIWNYIKNLVENISEIDQNNKYYIITPYKFNIKNSNFKQILIKNKLINKPIFNILWHKYFLPRDIKKLKLDILHLPAGNRRLTSSKKCKIISTIHDLSIYNVKNKYGILRDIYVKKILPRKINKVNKLISISENTKKDMVKHWKIKQNKIQIIPVGTSFTKSSNVLKLSRKYLLYVSRIEHPGKNHIRLIKAYEKLRDNTKFDHQLVFAGGDWNGSEIVKNYAKNSKYSKDIVFLGFVQDEYMPSLYKNASMLVFPSLYEGFGMPLVEAMHYKIPVICSNTSSMPEVLGDAGLIFDPKDVDEIYEIISKVLSDKKLQKQMIKKGERRAKLFDWKKIAKNFVKEYENLYKRKEKITIQDIKVDNINYQLTKKIIEDSLKGKKRSIAFVNAHCLNVTRKDFDYKERLNDFDLILADGIGLELASKFKGKKIKENLNGTDLIPKLLNDLENVKVFLLGGTQKVVEKTKKNIELNFSNVEIVGLHTGYFSDDDKIVKLINKIKADILLVSRGVPLQEKFISENKNKLNVKLIFGVGGLFDFMSGKNKRAPKWMRKLGLEWMYRIYQEPKRLWKRYFIGNVVFLYNAIKDI